MNQECPSFKRESQGATFQGYFPMWQPSKCAISHAVTSQVYPSRSSQPQPVLAAALGPPAHSIRSARPTLQPAAPQRA